MKERSGRSPITRARPASSQWCWQRGQDGGEGSTQALLPTNTGRRMSGEGHAAKGCSAAYSSLSVCVNLDDGRECSIVCALIGWGKESRKKRSSRGRCSWVHSSKGSCCCPQASKFVRRTLGRQRCLQLLASIATFRPKPFKIAFYDDVGYRSLVDGGVLEIERYLCRNSGCVGLDTPTYPCTPVHAVQLRVQRRCMRTCGVLALPRSGWTRTGQDDF
jgi:hypothetical protein